MSNSGSKKFNKWVAAVLTAIIVLLLLSAALTVIIDPVFHYHAPLDGLAYPLGELKTQRYINDGILRQFDYDAVIAGNSMIDNFKTSEADLLFDADFVKVPADGAYFKEVNDQLSRAFSYNDGIRYVIRAIDLYCLCFDKDAYNSDADIPDYLYNDTVFDDVYYVFNKDILVSSLKVLLYTAKGNDTESFDEYASWDAECGKNIVLWQYQINERADKQFSLSDDERKTVEASTEQNLLSLPSAHPETTFIYFFAPFSISYWDEMDSYGYVELRLEAIELISKMMLEYPNIKLYMFINDFDTVSNLNYYRDQAHYNADISSLLLEYMANGDYLVTEDNWDTLMTEARDFYLNYDYEALHDSEE